MVVGQVDKGIRLNPGRMTSCQKIKKRTPNSVSCSGTGLICQILLLTDNDDGSECPVLAAIIGVV